MARILRGEIRWADLNPVRGREQAGLQSVLILSHDICFLRQNRKEKEKNGGFECRSGRP